MKKKISLVISMVLLISMLVSVLSIPASAVSILSTANVKMFYNASKNSVSEVYKSSTGTSLPYRLYLPADYDETKSYPLVLFFHGAGEAGSNNDHIFNGGSILQRLLTKEEREKNPCIILAPQCGNTGNNGKWVSTPWEPGTYDHTKIQKSPFMSAAEELLDEVINEYAVDKGRLYVSGISMGGYGTWDIISRNPDKFAAAVPVCGGIDPSYMAGLSEMPIWTFHCKNDPIVSSAGTIKAAGLLKDNPNFKYTEYNRADHNAWTEAYSTDDLIEWMFSFKKDVADTPQTTPLDTTSPVTTAPITQSPVNTDDQVSDKTETTVPEDSVVETVPNTSEVENNDDGGNSLMVVLIVVGVVVVAGAACVVLFLKKKKN